MNTIFFNSLSFTKKNYYAFSKHALMSELATNIVRGRHRNKSYNKEVYKEIIKERLDQIPELYVKKFSYIEPLKTYNPYDVLSQINLKKEEIEYKKREVTKINKYVKEGYLKKKVNS